MKKKNKIVIAIFIAVLLTISVIVALPKKYATATTTTQNCITVRSFIKKLVVAMEIDVDKSETMPYITAAFDAGILQQGDVSTFDGNITRTECAVLLNRADEYLHGDTLESDYVQIILDKRISDIKKITKDKREAVAKIYGKGIIKGYSNGVAVQSREFRGDNYVTKGTANNFINLVINPKKRAKLSPDGQLIRTTNLPKNADKYEYILECFPNEFYEKPFEMEASKLTGNWKEGDMYDYPINMKDRKFKNMYTSYDMDEQMDWYLYSLADYVEQYVNLIFNINYKTIDESWCNAVKAISYNSSRMDQYLDNYILHAKYYKSIVETRKVAVEPSTFYFCGGYYMRVYVEYKVNARALVEDGREYIYANGFYDPNLKLGQWMTGYFDVEIATTDGSNGDFSTLRPDRSIYYMK